MRSIEDPALVSYLATPRDEPEVVKAYGAAHRIPATVCPLSNYRLKVFPDPRATNLLEMLDMGMLVTVNAEDPAYFRGYETENYLALLKWFAPGNPMCRPITLADIYRLCVNGFEASWMPTPRRRALIQEAADYFIRRPGTLYAESLPARAKGTGDAGSRR